MVKTFRPPVELEPPKFSWNAHPWPKPVPNCAPASLMKRSLALISDAVHNFSDVIALLLAWGATWLARKRPTQRHTYGYRRASILAALINAGLLLMPLPVSYLVGWFGYSGALLCLAPQGKPRGEKVFKKSNATRC